MSLKKQLDSLKAEKKSLEDQVQEANKLLAQLSQQKANLGKQAEELSARTSPLAKKLLEKTQKQLGEYEEQISIVNKRLEELKSNIPKTKAKIYELEQDTSQYIHEQVERMVSETLKYIKNHSEEIGCHLEMEFKLLGKTESIPDGLGSRCSVPTGDIALFRIEQWEKLEVTTSKDFFFPRALYSLEFEPNSNITCSKYSLWFKEFYQDFVDAFLTELQRKYAFADFKLTIGDSSFTLELV